MMEMDKIYGYVVFAGVIGVIVAMGYAMTAKTTKMRLLGFSGTAIVVLIFALGAINQALESDSTGKGTWVWALLLVVWFAYLMDKIRSTYKQHKSAD
jgi:EamA domain-containing membrane protein RarD